VKPRRAASALAVLGLSAALVSVPAHAQSQQVSSCFNGGEPRTRIAVWVFEGYPDWRAARQGAPAVLVFSFMPGKEFYATNELGGCFYMPADNRERVYRCESGSLRVTQVDLPMWVSGEYRLNLSNGATKALNFKAPYCPPIQR
jgi:hypothetical protein